MGSACPQLVRRSVRVSVAQLRRHGEPDFSAALLAQGITLSFEGAHYEESGVVTHRQVLLPLWRPAAPDTQAADNRRFLKTAELWMSVVKLHLICHRHVQLSKE